MAKNKNIAEEKKEVVAVVETPAIPTPLNIEETFGCGCYPIRKTVGENFVELLVATPMLNNGVILTTRVITKNDVKSSSFVIPDMKIYHRVKRKTHDTVECFGYYIAKFPDSTREGIESVGVLH